MTDPLRRAAVAGGARKAWAHGKVNGRALHTLLQELPEAVAFVDPAGGLLLSNHRQLEPQSLASASLGREGERLEVLHPDGRAFDTDEWPSLRSLRTGEVIVDEPFLRLASDGSRRSFSCRSSPIHDRKGRISAAVIIVRDVTDEHASRQQLAYLRPLLEHTGDAVTAVGSDWKVTIWNQAAEDMFGWTSEELLGEIPDFVRSASTPFERGERRRELARGQPLSLATVIEHKDGSPVSVELVAVPVKDAQGIITGYLGIYRDVGQRQGAAEAPHPAQQTTENILESISDSFFTVDRDWRYTFLNQRAVRQVSEVLGREVSAAELLGQSCWSTFPEWVGTPLYDAYEAALRTQQPRRLEVYVERLPGWFEVRLHPSPSGVSTYLCDITERKRSEGQLTYYASLLENMGDAVLGTDAEFALTAWNRRAQEMFGWSAAEALGRRVFELIPAGPADSELSDRLARLKGTGRIQVEGVWYGKGGRPVIAEALTVAIPGADGEGRGYLSIMRDVSARVSAEHERNEAREQERARVARDLHDDVLGALSATIAQATMARSEGPNRELWSEIIQSLLRVGRTLRGAIYDLRLDGETRTFSELLSDLVEDQGAMAPGRVVKLLGQDALPPGTLGDPGLEIVRIVREAVTNAVLHSGATEIRVDAGGSHPGRLHLEVVDNGSWSGRTAALDHPSGSGVAAMRERAALVGADLRITGNSSGGTTVAVDLPLPRAG